MFTVETKSHPGPVRVGRVHGATLRQAQAQRDAIERVTGLKVEPLLVYSRAWVDRPLARRKGVRVLPARMLIAPPAQAPGRRSRASEVEQARRSACATALREQRARASALTRSRAAPAR